jgi:predicted DNA-binding transcriptional regulator AlpA
MQTLVLCMFSFSSLIDVPRRRLAPHVRKGYQMADTYLVEREFAARYHVPRRTAQRWRVTGDGPPFVRLGPRRIAYRLQDCEDWARSRTFRSRADELAQQIA